MQRLPCLRDASLALRAVWRAVLVFRGEHAAVAAIIDDFATTELSRPIRRKVQIADVKDSPLFAHINVADVEPFRLQYSIYVDIDLLFRLPHRTRPMRSEGG